jgi:hypothetical protein
MSLLSAWSVRVNASSIERETLVVIASVAESESDTVRLVDRVIESATATESESERDTAVEAASAIDRVSAAVLVADSILATESDAEIVSDSGALKKLFLSIASVTTSESTAVLAADSAVAIESAADSVSESDLLMDLFTVIASAIPTVSDVDLDAARVLAAESAIPTVSDGDAVSRLFLVAASATATVSATVRTNDVVVAITSDTVSESAPADLCGANVLASESDTASESATLRSAPTAATDSDTETESAMCFVTDLTTPSVTATVSEAVRAIVHVTASVIVTVLEVGRLTTFDLWISMCMLSNVSLLELAVRAASPTSVTASALYFIPPVSKSEFDFRNRPFTTSVAPDAERPNTPM